VNWHSYLELFTFPEHLVSRTSASEFYKGLTKVITGLALSDVTPIIRDDTMKFYENCPNYDVSVFKNENVQYELNTFINSSYFQGVIKNVTNRNIFMTIYITSTLLTQGTQ
jgi:hypothetical protein